MSGTQCHLRLWSEVNAPLEAGETVESLRLINGRAVDVVAQSLASGMLVSREKRLPAAIAETSRLIASSETATLYQAAFMVKDLAVVTDVLRRKAQSFELVEIKSSTSVKAPHIPDAAYQALVLRAAKIPVSKVSIGYVNNAFVLRTPGNYKGFIAERDITEEVESLLPELEHSSNQLLGIMGQAQAPTVSIGAHCTDPYECPFIGRCTKGMRMPTYPVDLLPRGGKIIEELRSDGFVELTDVPLDRLDKEVHQRVHQATVTGQAFFDPGPTAPLRAFGYPQAYLDFETVAAAVPTLIGTKPYQQVPFQWSVHVEERPDRVRHFEYLAIESFGTGGFGS